jgi:hypothetical protein
MELGMENCYTVSMEKFGHAEVRTLEDQNKKSLEQIMQSINFEVLRDIFSEIGRKAGIEGDINFVPRNKIVLGAGYTDYDPFTNELRLRGLTSVTLMGRTADTLAEICHEETHAISTSKYKGEIKVESNNDTESRVSGLLYFERVGSGYSKDFYRWFNEGVTDKIAKKVFGEYLHRVPTVDIETGNRVRKESFVSGYPLAIIFVEEFCKRISRESGVPEDIVWGGLVRSYLHNENFDNPEIQDLLKEFFSEDFFKRLKQTEHNHHLIDLVYIVSLFFDVNRDRLNKLAKKFSFSTKD